MRPHLRKNEGTRPVHCPAAPSAGRTPRKERAGLLRWQMQGVAHRAPYRDAEVQRHCGLGSDRHCGSVFEGVVRGDVDGCPVWQFRLDGRPNPDGATVVARAVDHHRRVLGPALVEVGRAAAVVGLQPVHLGSRAIVGPDMVPRVDGIDFVDRLEVPAKETARTKGISHQRRPARRRHAPSGGSTAVVRRHCHASPTLTRASNSPAPSARARKRVGSRTHWCAHMSPPIGLAHVAGSALWAIFSARSANSTSP